MADGVQRLLAGHGSFRPLVVTHRAEEVACKNLPQPSRQFFLGAPAELLPGHMGLQQGLLHDIGRIELAAQPSVKPGLGQQA